jgi:glycosyltransferase involved in cell wall biosynthesis
MVTALDEAGFSVEVVTGFPSFPDGFVAPADRVFLRKTISARARLTRVFTYASPRLSGRSRLLNWFSVSISIAAYVALRRHHYDYVLVTTPPITMALPAFVSRLRRSKLVVDVRDVFPDVAVKMGYWREGSAVTRIVGFLAAALYRSASLVLCVTHAALQEVVARGSDPAKTLLAANGFDPIEVAPVSPYYHGASEFVAAFVGNMGLATGLDVILDAAEILKEDRGITFVLAGGGADKDRLAARVAERHLDNVRMIGVVSRPAANALLAGADVSIVPLHPAIVDSIPTKIFDALMLGCAVVCCANGEARRVIERSGGGIVVTPNDPSELAGVLKELAASPQRCVAYAASGRSYIERNFDRARIMRGVAARLVAMSEQSKSLAERTAL